MLRMSLKLNRIFCFYKYLSMGSDQWTSCSVVSLLSSLIFQSTTNNPCWLLSFTLSLYCVCVFECFTEQWNCTRKIEGSEIEGNAISRQESEGKFRRPCIFSYIQELIKQVMIRSTGDEENNVAFSSLTQFRSFASRLQTSTRQWTISNT